MFSNKSLKMIFSQPSCQLKLVQMANTKVPDLAMRAVHPALLVAGRQRLCALQKLTIFSMKLMQMEDTLSLMLNLRMHSTISMALLIADLPL